MIGYGWRGLRARIREGQARGNAEKCSPIHRWIPICRLRT